MADTDDTDADVRRAMRRLRRRRRPLTPEEAEIQRERREFLRRWKIGWSRRLRMRVTDKHISQLTGLTAGTIERKRNGKAAISGRMRPALENIDTVIALKGMPFDCPDDMRRAILHYQIGRPLLFP